MRRVLSFCRWKAAWWRSLPANRVDTDSSLSQGLHAFAEEQAALEDSIYDQWGGKWKGVRDAARSIIDTVLGAGWDLDLEEPGAPADREAEVIGLEIDEGDDEGDDTEGEYFD